LAPDRRNSVALPRVYDIAKEGKEKKKEEEEEEEIGRAHV